jgi:hypothetical protein
MGPKRKHQVFRRKSLSEKFKTFDTNERNFESFSYQTFQIMQNTGNETKQNVA